MENKITINYNPKEDNLFWNLGNQFHIYCAKLPSSFKVKNRQYHLMRWRLSQRLECWKEIIMGLNVCWNDNAQRGQTFIASSSAIAIEKHYTWRSVSVSCPSRWSCLINCCLDKSRRRIVEDQAGDRSIMPQRRLERWGCHGIFGVKKTLPHTEGCHSATHGEKIK